jgi:hypothetical protein
MSDIDDIFKTEDLKKIPIGKCLTVPVEMKDETIQVMACHIDDNEWDLEGKGIKGKLKLSDI